MEEITDKEVDRMATNIIALMDAADLMSKAIKALEDGKVAGDRNFLIVDADKIAEARRAMMAYDRIRFPKRWTTVMGCDDHDGCDQGPCRHRKETS